MLYEGKTHIQQETGATVQVFNLLPRSMNMDLRIESIHFSNNFVGPTYYGTWWFLIFPNVENIKPVFLFLFVEVMFIFLSVINLDQLCVITCAYGKSLLMLKHPRLWDI